MSNNIRSLIVDDSGLRQDPNRVPEKVALFNQDGSVFSGGGGSAGLSQIGETANFTVTDGSNAGGYVDATSGVQAQGDGGSLASGHVSDGAYIFAQNAGCFAMGVATNSGSYIYAGGGYSIADAKPTFAWGWATDGGQIAAWSGSVLMGWANGTDGEPLGQSKLYAGSPYGFVFGTAQGGGELSGSGSGAVTMGYANGSDAKVQSDGSGSFAFGYAATGETIRASAKNSAQFGVGQNSQANSLAVGENIRIGSSVPSTPRDGDIWTNANYVYIRSNGASVKIV